ERPCDLVAHARVAVLEVIAAWLLGLPVLVQFTRQAPGSSHQDIGRPGRLLYRADDLRIRGQPRCYRRGERLGCAQPAAAFLLGAPGPGIRHAPGAECGAELAQALAR